MVVEEIKRADDAPARRSSRDLFETSYRVHPYRLPVLGTPESVRATTRERILGFYRRHYTPEAMTLIAVGDVPLASVRLWAEELLGGDWKRPRAPGRHRPQEPARTGRRIHLVPDEAKEAWLNVAFAIPAANHEDVPALDVLAMLAGQGETSRLFRQVKRDARLVNEISAYAYTPVDPGLFGLGMTLPGDKLRPALTESLRTLAQLVTAPPTEEELGTIKALVESEAVYARETVQGLARKLGHYETALGGYEAEERYHARVAALTPDAVWQVARRYLDFDARGGDRAASGGSAADRGRRARGARRGTARAWRDHSGPPGAGGARGRHAQAEGNRPGSGEHHARDAPQRRAAHPPRGAGHAAGRDAGGVRERRCGSRPRRTTGSPRCSPGCSLAGPPRSEPRRSST